jgi:cysteine desulfurase
MTVIYLDHNATTPLAREAAEAMVAAAQLHFGNPASQHELGRRARQALEAARDEIGQMLGARTAGLHPDRVVFTSGGTEAKNLALLGMAAAGGEGSAPQAIVSTIEHPSVANLADELAARGWRIDRLPVRPDGVVELGPLDEWLTPETRFVSVMLANNETGVVQPVKEIAERSAALGVPLHVDAAQMAGKLPVDFRGLGATSMAVAAHKFHGPVGIGALVVSDELKLRGVLYGGSQQGGLRPGTESVALAAGAFVALRTWQRDAEARTARIAGLRDRLEQGLRELYCGEVVVNGAAAPRLPNTANVALVGLDRQALLMAFDQAGIACSTGSACASGSSEPSRVLAAMGCSKAVLTGSLRFSLGATTTEAEIDEALARIAGVCGKLLERRTERAAR